MKKLNHYKWLESNWEAIVAALGGDPANTWLFSKGLIGAHGDKFYCAMSDWERSGIPFHHGVAIGLMTHTPLFGKEVRSTPSGWVDVFAWVAAAYPRFRDSLSAIPDTESNSVTV